MLLATIDVWESAAESRSCRLLVFEDTTELELIGFGRTVLTMRFETTEEGLRCADGLRPSRSAADPKAA